MSTPAFAFDSPHDAIAKLLAGLVPVEARSVPLHDASGMVLSQPIVADRDSPPHDVSAMDGYAVRHDAIADLPTTLAVVGEAAIGQPPPPMPDQGCLKISTGACVPSGCDGVIPREQVEESEADITLRDPLVFHVGQCIRRRGEITPKGQRVAEAGLPITPPVAASLAAFGYEQVDVYRPVRIALITTGNELLPVGAAPQPWQIRDSNTPTLLAGLNAIRWTVVVACRTVEDTRAGVAQALRESPGQADLIVTTGGVSMGDHDYLKPALIDIGGRVIYHKLPIRPGKPSLGGMLTTKQSQHVPVVALPGNPVSVSVGLSLIVSPVARALAGFRQPVPSKPTLTVINPPAKHPLLWRYLPARRVADGQAELIPTQGSGDLAGAVQAEGYIEVPPGKDGSGPWVFYDAAV